MIATTEVKLYPTVKIDLRSAFNFEENEAVRIPLYSILVPGSDAWQSAFGYMESIGSSRLFKLDSHIVSENGTEKLEWWMRIYRNPEENCVTPSQEIDDEFDYEAERGL